MEKLGGQATLGAEIFSHASLIVHRLKVRGRTCNPVAHACPVSRCFARASTHAMSRCHGLTQLTRVATSLQPSRSSPLGPNRNAHASILPRRVSRNGASPPSTSLNQFSSNHDRFHRFDGRIWRGWAANKSKDAVASFRNASTERRSRRKLD